MPLSWNEIKSRAIAFSKEWSTETSERAEAQSFWSDAERVAFLFELYRRYTSLLPADAPKPKRVRTTGA